MINGHNLLYFIEFKALINSKLFVDVLKSSAAMSGKLNG